MTALDRIEQLDAMRLGMDHRFCIKLRDFELYVRPLSIIETVRVAQSVSERLNAMPPTQRTALLEHTFLAKETIIRSSTSDLESNDPKITDFILDRMTPDELQHLFKQYVAVCDKVNPALEMMKPGEVQELISAIKKNRPSDLDLRLRLTELSLLELLSLGYSFLTRDE